MWLPTLLIASLLGISHAAGNVTTEVQAFIAKFQQLNETKDVVESLEKIGETTKELFKIGRPVGEFLLTFNATGNATVEEIAALTELNKLFTTAVADISSRMHREGNSDVPRQYFHLNVAVEHSLTLMYYVEQLSNVTKRTGGGPEFMNYFGTFGEMLGHFDPLKAIDILDYVTRIGCHKPTKQAIVRVLKLQEAFRNLEQLARATWTKQEYQELVFIKNNLLLILRSHKNEDHIADLVKNISNINSISHDEVMAALSDIKDEHKVKNGVVQGKLCILEQILDETSFNQTVLSDVLRILNSDLQRTALLSWAFISMTEADEEYYSMNADITALSLARSGKFVAKWTRHVQNVTWPEIGVEFAKLAIQNDPEPFGSSLGDRAKMVQKAFEDHGSPSYSYQVLVVPTSEIDVSWSLGGVAIEDYVNITNFNGLDVHVFRFNRTEAVQRSAKAKKSIEGKREDLMQGMRHGATTTAKALLAQLLKDVATRPIISKNFYRSVIVLRKKHISAEVPLMPIGLATYAPFDYSFNLELTRSSFSAINHGRETTYTWKAIFFI